MSGLKPHLDWIETRADEMRRLLVQLCEINSHSHNVAGIDRVLEIIQARLGAMADRVERVRIGSATVADDGGQQSEKPLASVLVASKRADARFRVLLNIHADTVYSVDSSFQAVREVDGNTLVGPGVADAKGGIVVLLTALEAFERTELAQRIGWEVIINTDEEIGSPGSAVVLDSAARRNHLGLLYEPALPGGNLVSSRKGSGNYTIRVTGRAAHAGRDINAGRNAVVAASEIALELHAANASLGSATINIGRMSGGGATNVVPDVAMLMINARAKVPEDVQRVEAAIASAVSKINSREGFGASVTGRFTSAPKVLDEKTQTLLDLIQAAGRSIGLELGHGPSGGASDGNRLAAAGLPTIDSLGPRGGELHSEREFIQLDSLVERARLSLAVLADIAAKHGS